MSTVFPIERYLVPATPDPLPGGTVETRPLVQGLPETVVLDPDVSLVLVLPTGLATAWRDADPAAVVCSSAPETAAWLPAPETPVGDVTRAPLRAFVVFRGTPLATVPLAAGLHRVVTDDGNAVTGMFIELRFLDWEIRAGNLVGSGDLGSYLRLEWLRRGIASPTFATPPLDPHVAERLQRRFRMESQLGTGTAVTS